jgi:ribonuclease HI
MNSKVLLITDGAYSRKRNVGGYAFLVQYLVYNTEYELYELKKESSFSKQIINTTNNRMELQGAIDGLNYLKHPCHVEIISDATNLVNSVNIWINSFIKDPKRLNHDLMVLLHAAIKRHKSVKATWVRGHNGNTLNEIVDELAQKAAGTWRGK